MIRAALLAAGLGLTLTACGVGSDPATPALWQIDCPNERQGWLFGTVHALERPADWRSEAIDKALADADVLMVELADLDDAQGAALVWKKLATSPGQGPLSARVTPEKRAALAEVLKRTGLKDGQFDDTETWAAALTVAQAATPQTESAYGIDRAVMAASKGMQVKELEGREVQLSLFDRLPEKEQRDLLEAVIADAQRGRNEAADLAAAWRKGDMTAIEKETARGMLADPELREALFTGRNRNWASQIKKALDSGQTPFVAVGAAHLAGPQGLPDLIAESDCAVARVQ
ncbi:MAG: TraB/GumN family protein [Novosphingobium sp.]|nr:TraB/GumN family protein [Novosphingobium sp.]